ncbi:MAG: SGNH/GDSL hydrolase family protein [Alphaproteobacteria bacterium]
MGEGRRFARGRGVPRDAGLANHRGRRSVLVAAFGLLALLAAAAPSARAALFSDSISVSGDSISRAFNANTGSCNYGDNPGRAWMTGKDHGSNWCQAGGDGTFSHAERLECAKGSAVTIYNDSMSGATMLSEFRSQSTSIRQNLSGASGPRYVAVLMGHNDACTNTVDRTGNSCGGDRDPNNYCRTTKAAFEREFRAGLDQLIRIPSARILVLATIRISQLCNLSSKSSCGLGLGLSCNSLWRTLGAVNGVFGTNGVCLSLTDDCSDQRRIDMYNTLVGYNEVLERVSAEYAAIPAGGTSAGGATKASDVVLRYREGTFDVKLSNSDLSCCDCFHPSDQGHQKLARFAWDGFQCSDASPCCATSGVTVADAACSATDAQTFHPGGFWPNDVACGNEVVDPTEQCGEPSLPGGTCCNASCKVAAAGTTCRSAAGACDVAESCSGTTASCPADAVRDAGATCRASAGGCDPAETCDGTAVDCPSDGRSAAGTVCRAGGPCDVAETCDGSSAACPTDVVVEAGTACPDDGSICSTDRCDGAGRCAHQPANAGAVCRVATGNCDLA